MPKGRKKAWVCPECRAQFSAPNTPDPKNSAKGPGKLCSCGHWTPIWRLYRYKDRPYEGETRNGVLEKMRHFGLFGEIESLQVTIQALLGSYESALQSLPEGSMARGILEGSFKNTVIMAKRVLNEAGQRKGKGLSF